MYPRRRDEGWEEAFKAFLCEHQVALGGGDRMQARTLDAVARVAAGEFGNSPVDLTGAVAGSAAGAALRGVLVRTPYVPVADLLSAATDAHMAGDPQDVLAIHAYISENFAAPVDDFAVGFLGPRGEVQPVGFVAGRHLARRLALLTEAARKLGAGGAPPRPSPPIILNDDHLGTAAARLPELARCAVLIRQPTDDVLAGDTALAEEPHTGVRLIPERDLAVVDDYLFPAHLVAGTLSAGDPVGGRLDVLVPALGSTWRVIAPLNPERPAGERAAHALKRPKDLLLGLGGAMPEPWHLPVAGAVFPCGNDRPREADSVARERFVCIRGLADIFDALAGGPESQGAATPPVNG